MTQWQPVTTARGLLNMSEPNASIQMAKQSVVNMHNGLGDSAGELEKRFHWESSVRLAQVTR